MNHDRNREESAKVTLGARLRQRRWDEMRVFQMAVAAAAGISGAQLCEIERGTAGTTEGTLARLAHVLELDFGSLREQAEREGRLHRNRNRLDPDDPNAAALDGPLPDLPRLPVRPRLHANKEWLTATEAAKLLGCHPRTIRYLIRHGRLTPAIQEPHPRAGPRRWLVAAAAVEQYQPPNEGRHWPRRSEPPPPGHLSVDEFCVRVGVPRATLYRRIERWGLKSTLDRGRRWIPEDQIDAFHEFQAAEDAGI